MSFEIIATPPGKTIKEVLKQQHVSQKELAMLLEGETLLTMEIVNKLEKTLGVPARFWTRLEEIYLKKLALIKERTNGGRRRMTNEKDE